MNIYKDIVMSQIPRVLGLGDRNPDSKTFGCFDRHYWHYKVIDFANARYQEIVLLLVLLYKNNFEGNIYYQNNILYNWIIGTMDFWTKIQNRCGAFNEYYPNENSFCVTSFLTYCISETLLILNSDELKAKYKKPLTTSASWLSKMNNPLVSNQMAGSVTALFNVYLLYSDEKYLSAAQEKLNSLKNMQDGSGAFVEYGGGDTGYQSLTIDQLAKYYIKSEDDSVLENIEVGINYIDKNIDKYCWHDSEKNSRGTQFFYPHGFKLMKKDSIISKHIVGLEKNKILNPVWMDDRYSHLLVTNYLQTYLEK